MIVRLLTEHHLDFLSLKGGCRGSSKYTLVKMSNCWKSHALTQFKFVSALYVFQGEYGKSARRYVLLMRLKPLIPFSEPLINILQPSTINYIILALVI